MITKSGVLCWTQSHCEVYWWLKIELTSCFLWYHLISFTVQFWGFTEAEGIVSQCILYSFRLYISSLVIHHENYLDSLFSSTMVIFIKSLSQLSLFHPLVYLFPLFFLLTFLLPFCFGFRFQYETFSPFCPCYKVAQDASVSLNWCVYAFPRLAYLGWCEVVQELL